MVSAANRIANIFLDEKLVIRRSPQVEHERKVAIYDLLVENEFILLEGELGPYNLHLAVEDDRLVAYVNFEVGDTGVWVKEACALHGFETVYRDLAQVVVDRAGSKAIEGSLPRNHPFMQDLVEASGSTPEWGAHDEMMVKLVNWETLTEKLGGIHIPASPPESETDLWNTLLGRADALACPPIRPWIGSLEPCDEVFYWWTDVF